MSRELTFMGAGWDNPVEITMPVAGPRCDNTIGNRQPGCVYAIFPGLAAFSQTTNPEFVSHIYQAQVSGLPGRLNSGTYLTKLADQTLVNKNGSTACPSSLNRPEGDYDCDEYPFRSTYEGAYTGGGGEARSFDGCQMPDPERTGPTGWSRCFISSTDNRSAGGYLSAFYSDECILDGDRFEIGYLPWSRGA